MIKRRKAITSIAAGIGTMIAWPSWAKSWNAQSLGNTTFLNPVDNDMLVALVDTIIPATDTPGAKDVGVPALIQLLVKDCQPKAVQDTFRLGLVITNAVAISQYGKSFVDLSSAEKLTILKSMAASEYPDQKNFINMIKRMTIEGYMQSEYVMTNITKYEMAPNRYYGCVKS